MEHQLVGWLRGTEAQIFHILYLPKSHSSLPPFTAVRETLNLSEPLRADGLPPFPSRGVHLCTPDSVRLSGRAFASNRANECIIETHDSAYVVIYVIFR